MKSFRVLGLMSGTSLDGLDLACCRFSRTKQGWKFAIEAAETVPYNPDWSVRLRKAHLLSGENLMALHAAYGDYLGKRVLQFMKKHDIRKPHCVASHGHTIFHQPSNRFTFQLGDGGAIHAACGLPVVSDFRSLDVQLGGQGAPLVPIGDRLLFARYAACVNLGGIANISMEKKGRRVAWDICFVNQALNHLAGLAGENFDRNGAMARRGRVLPDLLEALHALHRIESGRLSLGREDFEREFLPLIASDGQVEDRLRTVTEYVAVQVASAIALCNGGKVLITGGGAHHAFLLERIRLILWETCRKTISIEAASSQIIDFKEALVFAFLGVLRLLGEVNVLSSVTGAKRDSCSGITYGC